MGWKSKRLRYEEGEIYLLLRINSHTTGKGDHYKKVGPINFLEIAEAMGYKEFYREAVESIKVYLAKRYKIKAGEVPQVLLESYIRELLRKYRGRKLNNGVRISGGRLTYEPREEAIFLKISLDGGCRSYRIPLSLLTAFIPHNELYFLGVKAIEVYLKKKLGVSEVDHTTLEEECLRLLRNFQY